MKKLKKILIISAIIFVFVPTVVFTFISAITEPSNKRDWNDDQQKLPSADINDNIVSVKNIRNFSYASTTSYTPNYYDASFNLDDLERVWYIVEPFKGIPGSAHTFLSFEFKNNKFISISVEVRKEKGESYSPIKGLFNTYEIMYVIADERDVIKLRSNYRKDPVYLYPMKASREKARELFLEMLDRANQLHDKPEFYNTITNTCTTNIAKHVDAITPGTIPLRSLRILLPANSDKLAYDLGLIDTDLPFDEARVRYYINDKAMQYGDDPHFSAKIRE